MRKDYTDITFILDASGSMGNLVSDTLGGFNNFIREQRKTEGACTVNLYQFNTQLRPIFEATTLANVPELTTRNYRPSGGTALLDALGTVIDNTGNRYAAMPEHERPENVIFVIITDGLENSSREFTRAQIKERIEHQTEKYEWEFIYLGADQDAFAEAGGIGISRASNYKRGNTRASYDLMSMKLANLRGKKGGSRAEKRRMLDFTDEDYKRLNE